MERTNFTYNGLKAKFDFCTYEASEAKFKELVELLKQLGVVPETQNNTVRRVEVLTGDGVRKTNINLYVEMDNITAIGAIEIFEKIKTLLSQG